MKRIFIYVKTGELIFTTTKASFSLHEWGVSFVGFLGNDTEESSYHIPWSNIKYVVENTT